LTILIEFSRQFRIAFTLLVFFTIVTGVLYPVIVTGIAQCFFPRQANGSIVTQDNLAVGSELIGQSFTDPKYFWGRPSATTPYAYNAEASSGSNLGPMNPDLLKAVKQRMQTLQFADRPNTTPVPVDLVTASASGLDPDISPLAARYQVYRIAKARNLAADKVETLIATMTKKRFLGVLGEPRINVLQLNLALDALDKNLHSSKGA
jgi:K+-transporting ATPase ATPase C chain